MIQNLFLHQKCLHFLQNLQRIRQVSDNTMGQVQLCVLYASMSGICQLSILRGFPTQIFEKFGLGEKEKRKHLDFLLMLLTEAILK